MSTCSLAENLRELRILHQYTQQQVSDQLHIARQTYSQYETGKRIPDLEIISHLAALYDISVDTLLHTDLTGKYIAEKSAGHSALMPGNSLIPLTGADAKMLMDYKGFPPSVQKEIREFVRFKKQLLAKGNQGS